MSGDKGFGPTVVNLPKPPDEFQAAADAMARLLPAMIQHAEWQAKIRRASYLALVKQGFTEAQALDLCWRTE